MKKYLLLLLPILISCSPKNNQTKELYKLDDFEFSIVWGLSKSSYDSKTGELVKTRDVIEHKPEDYITNYILSNDEKEMIFNKAIETNVYSYEENYNPYLKDNNPPLIRPSSGLTYEDSYTKIKVHVYFSPKMYTPTNKKGRMLVEYFETIIDILINTEEWKSLPNYEVLYD